MNKSIPGIEKIKPPKPQTEKQELVKVDDDAGLLAYFPKKVLKNANMTQSQVTALKRDLVKSTTGGISTYLPMICMATKCPIAYRCPIMRDYPELIPLGHACPIEAMSVDYMNNEITETVRTNLGKEADDFLVKMIIEELIVLEIMERRMSGDIATNGYISKTPMVLAGPGGKVEPLMKDDIAPSAEMIMRINTKKHKILEALLATPEVKVKTGISKVRDESVVQTEKREMSDIIGKILDQLKVEQTNTTDVDYEELDG